MARQRFDEAARDAVYRVIHARRDMRHFAGGCVPEDALARILAAGHAAPSVGLMQPWRFIRITDAELRERLAACVEAKRRRTAAAMGGRKEAFLRLKVEGVRECAELIVAALAPDDGTVFGRRTMPQQMALASCACAIQNMWLAARAENLGMGWVSFFEPADVAALLELPAGAQPVALLCLGPVARFYDAPMLEEEGWRMRRPLAEIVGENRWPEAGQWETASEQGSFFEVKG